MEYNSVPYRCSTYFEPDKKKAGGAYKTIEGQLQNIDDYNQTIVLKNGEVIPLKSILDIQLQLWWKKKKKTHLFISHY